MVYKSTAHAHNCGFPLRSPYLYLVDPIFLVHPFSLNPFCLKYLLKMSYNKLNFFFVLTYLEILFCAKSKNLISSELRFLKDCRNSSG